MKVLVIGAGSIAVRHVRILRDMCSNAEIKIWSITGRVLEYQIDGIEVYTDQIEAVSYDPELVLITSTANLHVEHINLFDLNQVTIFVEKPVSDRSDIALEFLKNNLASKKVMVGYNLRYMESLRFFRACVQEKIADTQPFFFKIEVGHDCRTWRSGNWRDSLSLHKNRGGGVLLELSHEIDYMLWILGTPTWVSAWVGRSTEFHSEVEDTVFATLEIDNKQLSRRFVGSLHMDFIRSEPLRTCSVVYDGGAIVWNALAGTVSRVSDGRARSSIIFQKQSDLQDSYKKQMEALIEFTNQGRLPADAADFAQGIRVLQVIDALRASGINRQMACDVDLLCP